MRIFRAMTFSEVSEIYHRYLHEYFPPGEVKPLTTIERLWKEGLYYTYGLYDEDILLGFAMMVTAPGESASLLDYLAVVKEHRGSGAGSLILSSLRKLESGHVIMIETDDPDEAKSVSEREICIRRNRFYERSGAVLSDLRTDVYDCPFYIWQLTDGDLLGREALTASMISIYKYMIPEPDYSLRVQIPKKCM